MLIRRMILLTTLIAMLGVARHLPGRRKRRPRKLRNRICSRD